MSPRTRKSPRRPFERLTEEDQNTVRQDAKKDVDIMRDHDDRFLLINPQESEYAATQEGLEDEAAELMLLADRYRHPAKQKRPSLSNVKEIKAMEPDAGAETPGIDEDEGPCIRLDDPKYL